jgi:GNAT superfamily N-acetyltransferase
MTIERTMSIRATNTAITIRETGLDDLEEILQHRRLMFYDMGFQDQAVLEAMVRTSRLSLQRYLGEGSYQGWFAVTADWRTAAGAGLLITPWVSGPTNPEQANRAYLLNVYTYPNFRKQGLARLLTETAIEWCRKHGFKILWLHASEFGRPLYESLGFEPTNEMKLTID